jgi:hypothetical protein
MSSKPKAPELPEDEYWRMFHAIRGDVEVAIKSNSAYWKINSLALADNKVLATYNRHAHFWKLNTYALQTTFFMAFDRIFDDRRDCFSVQKLIDATIKNPAFFSKTALRARKRQISHITGADPQWLVDDVNAAWEPTTADLQTRKAALAPHHQQFKAIYQPIRHTHFAHRGAASDEAIFALFGKTLPVSRSCQARNPVWLASVSGNGFGLRGGLVPVAELVPDRECRCVEPNRSRSIERAQSP